MRSARLKHALHYLLFTAFWLSLTLGLNHVLTVTAHAQNATSLQTLNTLTPNSSPPNSLPQRPIHIRVDEPLIIGAAHHAEFTQKLAHINMSQIKAPQDLDTAINGLLQLFSPTLGASFLSYGALIGSLNPDFVHGLTNTAHTKGLDVVIYNLYSNPNYAAQIIGSDAALADIKTAWEQDIARVVSAGADVKQQSYHLQKQKQWKQLSKANRQARINFVKQTSRPFPLPPLSERQRLANIGRYQTSDHASDQYTQNKNLGFLRQSERVLVNSPLPAVTSGANSAISAMANKALTLAALEILGASGGQSKPWIKAYMRSPKLNQCINKARLNMQQCLAATHFKYEDAFCLSQHELIETSDCLQQSLF